jgi:hypothetical protein
MERLHVSARTLLVTIILVGATGIISPWTRNAVLARSVGTSLYAAQPNLGRMTVQPKNVHVGQTITLRGVTHGFVQFLPPFITIQSARTQTVHFGPGPCQGRRREPVASFTKPGGGSGGPGTRQNPPSGTAWKVHIRIPAHMDQVGSAGKTMTVPTPPGRYLVIAVGVGLDFCTLPTTSNATFSEGHLQIIP